ncbi:MAG TPA: TRAP transporter small permease [Pseudogracilibacillus sp.]|nr:TRAP transporter small permease [Pseudogracilibacillus sp.]
MKKVTKGILIILYTLSVVLMATMLISVSLQVISRYIFGNPFTWTEELARYSFVWVTFIGMTIGVKKGSHIALDVLQRVLKGRSKFILQLINYGLLILFSIALMISGWHLYELGLRQTSPSLTLPMNLVYSIIPLSGLLMIYFVITELFSKKEQKG